MPTLVRPVQLPNRVRADPRRSAEIKLYDALRLQLGEGWSIFYSVAWLAPSRGAAPRDGEADFIVAHPQKGVLLIEVKGGRIRYDAERRQWISRDRAEVDHDIDPFDQVRASKHALIAKLRASRALRDVWVDLSHAVAFPDVERPHQAVAPDAPSEIIIGRDDLDRLPARIEEILAYAEPGTQRRFDNGPALIRELTTLLGQSTELRNPLALEAAEEDREFVRLTEEQFRLLDTLSRVRRAAIGGCAGSGKTFLAAEKAKRLAREEFRTLLTCFNRPLADNLARATAGTPNLDVMTFHALCRRLIQDAGLAVPEIHDFPDALCEAVGRLPDRRYDAIMVDEGQDFEDTWWVALSDCLEDKDRGIFYVFYDDHQVLYRGRGSLPGDLIEFPLIENIRNTRSIYQVLAHHYQGEGPPRSRGPVGRTVETQTYQTEADLRTLLSKVLHRLLVVEGFKNEDIIVLTPRPLERSALPRMQLKGALKLVSEEPIPRSQQILLTTVRLFKGLERQVVIVAELDDQMPAGDPHRDAEREMLCYVAFSRPRSHLILLGSPTQIPRLLPPPR